MTAKIVEAAADKIGQYYVPPYATVEDVSHDQMVWIVTAEQTANIAPLQPSIKVYYEINCADRMMQELSISVRTRDRFTKGTDTPTKWKNVPPESNAATLLKLLCPPQ